MIRSVLYMPKHTKPTDENIGRLLLPSVVGTLICMACLAGTTWAWFSASVTTPPQMLTAANYEVEVSVNDAPAIPAENGRYRLEPGSNTVKLTAVGSASSGYCKIIFGGDTENPYYTPQFPNPEEPTPTAEFIFTVNVAAETEMVVIPTWGTYTGKDVIGDATLELPVPTSEGRTQSENSNPPSDDTTPSGENTH